jgi:sugar/nucleoside kinase (ribokinase family)
MLVLDGNLSNDVLKTLVARAKMLRVPTLFEPVSLTKCRNILGKDGKILPVDYITPNEEELRSMLRHPDIAASEAIEHMSAKTLIQQMGLHEEHGVTTAIVTVGAEGVVFSKELGSFESNQVAAAPPIADGNNDVVNTTGCGDSFVGGFVHGIVSGKGKTGSIDLGQRCARAAMLSESAVNPQLAKLIKV